MLKKNIAGSHSTSADSDAPETGGNQGGIIHAEQSKKINLGPADRGVPDQRGTVRSHGRDDRE